MKILLAIALFLAWAAPLGAAETPTGSQNLYPALSGIPTSQAAPSMACPATDRLTQVTQSDCCKGHKGVCGCRAGKIVCCDNTTSANCTCHADSGVEN